MCKKPIQIDALDSCLGEEGADLPHSKQDTRYNAIMQILLFFFRRELED